MIELGKGREKGQWWGCTDGVKTSATIKCPECGRLQGINTHTIAEDGTVSPSVVCNFCSFHDYIKLVGWEAE